MRARDAQEQVPRQSGLSFAQLDRARHFLWILLLSVGMKCLSQGATPSRHRRLVTFLHFSRSHFPRRGQTYCLPAIVSAAAQCQSQLRLTQIASAEKLKQLRARLLEQKRAP